MKKKSSVSNSLKLVGVLGAMAIGSSANLHAADWSDTSIGWRYGTHFAEPYETNNMVSVIIPSSTLSSTA